MSEASGEGGGSELKAITVGQRADIYINKPQHEANLNQHKLAQEAEASRKKVLKAEYDPTIVKIGEEPIQGTKVEKTLRKPPSLPPKIPTDAEIKALNATQPTPQTEVEPPPSADAIEKDEYAGTNITRLPVEPSEKVA